jgi:hypothetical protein
MAGGEEGTAKGDMPSPFAAAAHKLRHSSVFGLDSGAQLFLTEEWIADRKRREKTRVPKQIKFQTKPQIAAEMIRRTRAVGRVQFDWIMIVPSGAAFLASSRASIILFLSSRLRRRQRLA